MRELGMGQSLPRYEDGRFLRGRGRFTDDLALLRPAHLFVLRSPHAAARLRAIDIEAARIAAGVLAIATGADAVAEGLGTFSSRVRRARADGSPNFEPPYRVLAHKRVRHVGDPVAAIVAETLAQAKDAAELIEVDYEPLTSVVATAEAMRQGAPAVWDDTPDNVCFLFRLGDHAAVDAAFARAAHITRVEFTISRVSANPLEPRNAVGLFDLADGRYTLHAGVQAPHQLRTELAEEIFRIPGHRVRVVAGDIGGSFGMKGGHFPELALVLWMARKTGRQVRWTCERSEAFVSDHHSRDNVSRVELALERDGRFLALRLDTSANLGAYLAYNGTHCPTNNVGGVAGVYTTPAISVTVRGVFTNTSPTGPYRGAGRPEASFAIERVIDVAAAEMGIDRIEIRRRNMIASSAMPYKTGLVFTYDSGEFETVLDRALAMADWRGFAARRAAARLRGRLRGIGLACVIEIAGGPPGVPFEEGAEIRFDPTGSATILVGTHSHGQGHETMFRQLVAEILGLAPDRVDVVYGDTDRVTHGCGTFGPRSASVGAAVLVRAAEKIVAKGRKIAAHLLEVGESDIEFARGRFTIAGTDRGIDLAAVARVSFEPTRLPAGLEAGLAEAAIVTPPGPTFPNGAHICEVEIDPETGAVEVVGYWVVDDVGTIINPLLLKGQVHGGVAQGLGQALGERIVYDAESGQLLSGSFMDYGMPRADELPFFEVASHVVPARSNPFGIKGAGEAGTIGALPAAVNAIVDALSPFGIRHFDMPATPERIWRAIATARVQL